jgi:excisionase family DNA binding protein
MSERIMVDYDQLVNDVVARLEQVLREKPVIEPMVFSLREAGKLLGVNPSTVSDWIDAGRISKLDQAMTGKRVLIRREEIVRFVTESEVRGPFTAD